MFSKRIISMLVVLSFISQALVVVDTDSYSSVVVEDSSILEELSGQDGARTSPSNLSVPFTDFAGGTGSCSCMGSTTFTNGKIMIFAADSDNATYGGYDKGLQLYVTDGTLTGTSMIKEINEGGIPVSQFNSAISHTWHNDVLYFALDDGIHGKEFWRTDGTEEGTYLVKDIREGEVGSFPAGFKVWKNHFYFSAMDSSTTGYELWKSDGTEDGTAMLKEIYPGDNWDESSYPGGFIEFKGKLYFSAEDEDHGDELWTTDGTEEGTVLFMDIDSREGSTGFQYGSSPSNFLIFNEFLYFTASNASGKELWKTDGTIEGTVLVKDIVPGTTGSQIRGIVPSNLDTSRLGSTKFAVIDDHFYFQVQLCGSADCVNIWKSDGTEEGTVAVTSFEEGDDIQIIATYRGGYVLGESKIVFVVEHPEYDEELWITDGTLEGTHLVKDINVDDDGDGGNDGDSYITRIVAGSGDIFYFSANPGVVNEDALWRTDGTENGTYEVDSLPINGQSLHKVGNSNSGMTPFGNHLIFSGSVSSPGGACGVGCGEDFWILHNISSGSAPSKPSYSVYENEVIEPITFDYLESYREEAAYKGSGNISVITPSPFYSSEDHVVVNDIIFFHATTDEYGDALWKTDGTAEGVELVKDINPGSYAEIYHGLTRFKDSILFSANDGTHGEELWISDGTENGTFMLKDMDEGGEDSDSDPWGFLDAGDVAYFSGSDDSEDRELWKTDGTTNGTVRVKDIVSGGSSYPSQLTLFGDEVFFVVGDQHLTSQLWKTDGTDEGTIRISGVSSIRELTVMGDALYFRASGTSCGGSELHKTDGTSDGTVCVKDINPGSDSSTPQTLTAAGGTLFFNADDGTHGGELWKSDGTEDGTVLVKDIRSGGAHSQILDMASIGNIVYFGAHDGSIGNELWRSDGTEDGTYLVKDIASGWESSYPDQIAPIGDRLFFTADDDEAGDEVWISDGTESGTVMVANVNQNQYDSNPVEYVKLGNLIVFAAHLGTQRLVSYDPTDILYHSSEGMHWSISPSLPEGLSLDSNTGKITGIPTEVIDWTDYTVNLSVANSHPPYYYNFTFDFKLQVLEQLYPIFPSEDSADLAIDEPMVNITFQYDLKSAGTLVNQNIALAARSTCAIVENGTVACWGGGTLYTLGNGVAANSGTPIFTASMPDNRSVVAIDAGGGNACALLDNGSVACWGDSNGDSDVYGEMGDGDTAANTVPELTYITGSALSAISISVAYTSACAILDNGSVSCWGDNRWGQVGDNTTINRFSPTQTFPFADGKKATAITSGTYHHCALLDDGTVSCWGRNNEGQLGDNTTNSSYVSMPTHSLGGPAIAISSNQDHTCAVLENGSVVCWGRNDHGQVGIGSSNPDKVLVPTAINSDILNGKSAIAVSTGDDHTCAILDDNSVKCWGRNNAKQLGNGGDFGGDKAKIAIESNGDHTCVLIEDGSIYCWGRNSQGQIGDGEGPCGSADSCSSAPVQVSSSYSFLTEDNSLMNSIVNVTGATCSISPDLPDGLTIAQDTCTISGTPLEETPSKTYVVSAEIYDNTYTTRVSLSTYYPDSDGDGYLDYLDDFPDDPTEWLDTDKDGTGNNADTDDDGDGLTDVQEQNSDPATESLYPDTDDDGYCDGPISVTIDDVLICEAGPDAFPTDPDEWNDNDGDGIGDNEDPDDDNDNFLDVDEIANGSDSFDGCSPNENSTACDIDNDGLPKGAEGAIGTNVTNPDTDGDGFCDGPLTVIGVCIGGDDFPLDVGAHKDTDGDGIPDNLTGPSTSEPALVEDPDDDNDGLTDIEEDANGNGTFDAGETNSLDPDTDDDGYCDGPVSVTIRDVLICEAGPDAFPLNPSEWLDTDGDEIGNNEDPDDDGDGLNDTLEDVNGNGTVDAGETGPLKPDTDGDGFCDGPVTIVDVCEAIDAFPTDETEWFDTDGDDIGDNSDPDVDGDGVNNEQDDFPDDPSASKDTDGDGMPDTITGNSTSDPALIEDLDDDNDGLTDIEEDINANGAFDDGETNSLDPDTDDDGYCDGNVTIVDVCVAVDAFPLDSSEWLDTDGDGVGNEADTDDDGDGLNDTEEISLGSNPLVKDSDDDGIPDNWDPLPVDPDGDADGDGILDRDEYNPNSTTGNPADSDGDGVNDMLQGVASTNATSDSGRSFDEFCWWFLLLLLLLLIPLLKRQYDNALIYTPHIVEYTIGAKEDKIIMKPSLHETAQKFREFTNRGKLRRVTYAISGNLVEGMDIDSKTGIISGHPKKVGTFTNEVVMKHSKGKFLGEIQFIVTEKGKEVEKEEKSEPVLTTNPEPENASSKPKFVGGAGTKMDPFVLSPAKGLEPGEEISSKQILTISGLKSDGVVNAKDLNSKDNGKRFSVVSELDDSGKSSSLKVNDDGKIKFRINFNDDKPSTNGAEYEALMKLGTASVYVSWAVEVVKEESEPEPEPESKPEPEPEPKPKPVVTEKEVKKQEELDRVKARSESIDFKVIGVATQSTLASEVEGGASEVELANASEFETEGTATITDADGSETFTWRGKKGDQLTGVAGITRTFVAASIVVSKDDLQVIKGIGPFIEEKLNALGIYTYRQLANMTPELEDQVNEAIEFFPGRVKRDQWVAQAKILIGEDAELDEKALKKAEELDRVAAKAEGIDFGILGVASASDRDNLQEIKGIGPFIEEKLNALGIFKFSQIAKMTSEIEEEVNVAIEFFPGRVKRDEWVKQAAELAK